ncbi:MAG: aminoacyl-tRNA hydrolase [Oceanospirillaceae bacterium]|jgi:PTH1 family peptidyl-tRNA hydrolase|nr:aminoacyl-tRNA hydrolase [Oceanospirillaceae bacterium]MBT6100836.1 aminoacyl-tRNA hydrolase [Oceanospirillaceae bacterium]MBT7673741.1 aminoacyl-tRNA hydrolase [Oceanospirillaceae bacterium]MDC0085449.1 aminoacyl-tRNA hydrolase [Oceanospirillaceae bacterium]MDO7574313.1 aminoacyl-tRNA hydrolase [Oceanospirillaceae bacterium]
MSNTLPAEPIKLIVGLGNPGVKYERTRHNAGQDWLVQLAGAEGITLAPEKRFFGDYGQGLVAGHKVHLLIPHTFMNLSGQSVQALCNFYKIDTQHILVAHDELDLPPGTARLKLGGGHGGHNGLRDIINKRSGDKNFHRLRLGIGHPGNAKLVTNYVLKKAPLEERISIDHAMEKAIKAMSDAISGQWQKAMNDLHTS